MDALHLKRTHNPEADIQRAIIKFLEQRGWVIMVTHGNSVQKGFPDLYCLHRNYGQRWIEVKNPSAYSFTPAQLKFFPAMNQAGIGVWVMVAATLEQYATLFIKSEDGCGSWKKYYRQYLLLGSRNLAKS